MSHGPSPTLGSVAAGVAVAAGMGGLGQLATYARGGDPFALAAAGAGALIVVAQTTLLLALRRGAPWAPTGMLAVAPVLVPLAALVESELGTLMYLAFGMLYLAMMAQVVSPRPARWQALAASLFTVTLVARHLLRPLAAVDDPIELYAAALAGGVAIWFLSRWSKALFDELEVARDAALEASFAKDRFLAAMSHELRTPLNAIVGYSELLLEGEEDEEERKRDLGSIRSASRHLLGLLSEVLDLARLEHGRESAQLVDLDLRSVVDEVVATCAVAAAARGNTLTGEVQGDPLFYTDATWLRQILLNLVTNAVKFTERGAVRIRVSGTDRVVIEVTDTGVGIPPDHLARVFERFYQVDSSSTRRHGGVGLGLALVRALTERLGGEVSATSEVGRGSTFRVELPRRARPLTLLDEAA